MPENEQDARARDARADKLRDLPREVSPGRNLWPEIARRIERRRGRLALVRRAVPLVFVAAAASYLLYMSRAPREVLPATPPAVSVAVAPPSVPPAPEAALFPGETEYVRAADALLAEFKSDRASLPEATVHVFDENLAIIDRAIEACRGALTDHPDDPELRASLELAYDEKLELLRTAVELSMGS
jgi:hypothetical protein